uniref:Steroidogenic acute regulatory protein, mitochondrial n=1 Tax=Gopherus evgoodei TaxID=1825980 RepID=A0A8C4WKR5_9SAUR
MWSHQSVLVFQTQNWHSMARTYNSVSMSSSLSSPLCRSRLLLTWLCRSRFSIDCTRMREIWFSNTELSYVNQGEAALREALGILQQQNGWQTETYQGKGELVLSTVLPRLGKVFRMETVLDVPVDQLYYELFEKLEQMPEWNPTLSRVKILQRIGKDTLLTHEITAQHPGNLIGQRDFVSVRHCWKKETTVYLVGTATHSEFMPMQKGQVRAESGLSCIVLQPLEGDQRHTRFTWLLCMDLKVSSCCLARIYDHFAPGTCGRKATGAVMQPFPAVCFRCPGQLAKR